MARDSAILVKGLGKRYTIRHEGTRFPTLRDAIAQVAGSVVRGSPRQRRREEFWALRGVSFEVGMGDVVGIIGRNGAGKSTLLKILSRITEPTEGFAEINGSVRSLLEVGTGFHPELTGRENIYLNGAIMGMAKAEIRRKFDAIVAFAEVEKFVDTPVKRYSSGMYVRLAFSVAAHMEPDILLIDEVLAVGDAEFQKKCLGKIEDVAGEGRTILFVSHNLNTIKALCPRTAYLKGGNLVMFDATAEVLSAYLSDSRLAGGNLWESGEGDDGKLRLLSLRVSSAQEGDAPVFPSSRPVFVDLVFSCPSDDTGLSAGFDLVAADGIVILRSLQTDLPEDRWLRARRGVNRWRCVIPPGLLREGRFFISPRIGRPDQRWEVALDSAVEFSVMRDHSPSPLWHSESARNRPGYVAPVFDWVSEKTTPA